MIYSMIPKDRELRYRNSIAKLLENGAAMSKSKIVSSLRGGRQDMAAVLDKMAEEGVLAVGSAKIGRQAVRVYSAAKARPNPVVNEQLSLPVASLTPQQKAVIDAAIDWKKANKQPKHGRQRILWAAVEKLEGPKPEKLYRVGPWLDGSSNGSRLMAAADIDPKTKNPRWMVALLRGANGAEVYQAQQLAEPLSAASAIHPRKKGGPWYPTTKPLSANG